MEITTFIRLVTHRKPVEEEVRKTLESEAQTVDFQTTSPNDDGPNVDIKPTGEYINVFVDGELRLSISSPHNELLLYDGSEEPAHKFELAPARTDGGTPSAQRWVDTHSVTCAICGRNADERETVNVTDDIEELGPAMQVENPSRFEAILAAVDEFGEGEAHQDCFADFKTNLSE